MKNRLLVFSLAVSLLLSACDFSFSGGSETDSGTSSTTSSISGAQVNYTVSYDNTKWIVTPSDPTADTEYDFEHTDGDVYAMVIPERITVDLDTLKEAALANAQAVAPDAVITFEEEQTVNGVNLLVMKMTGTIYGTPFTYYGYYYGGTAGTIQFITYTTGDLMPQYEADLTELLKGLVIKE